ncbi:MAG: hypothetical protein GWM90_11505 [Gemmatimonadetes bacterium]|nr:hypothetical protein [Gemmatimonadota bacterium]NIQ54614.1 hypothetical protein [Gemmatimonadota bacterium]NIU74820.1 hypothetical protein [Gammaproteobacteria bacterium]NIX44719.1 hypothetical protein [Gemmatimonadota bacterium]NIY08953.1 hypothetical protein [Gemmatimonadota bacterium]
MATELEHEVNALETGTHACLLYDDRAEQMAAVVPFIHEGLRLGHRCLYIVDDCTAADVFAALSVADADVIGAVRSGALAVHAKQETYLRGGRFDPDAMLAFLADAIDDAVEAGYPRLRGTGEMTWALGPEPGTDRLLDYEAQLTGMIAPRPALIICQYNRPRFPPEIIRGVLLTHPTAIVGRRVYDNPFNERPDLLPPGMTPAQEVDWMLRELEERRAAAAGGGRANG